MQRRTVLKLALGGLVAAAPSHVLAWNPQVRVVIGKRASLVEQTVARDVAQLLSVALGSPVQVVVEGRRAVLGDLVLGTRSSCDLLAGVEQPPAPPGSYLWVPLAQGDGVALVGTDPEGARNAAYAWLESRYNMSFFRDGDRIPEVDDVPMFETTAQWSPRFRLRGEMIWDFYPGPLRYCAATWGPAQWERALLYMARNRMNFLEFYPPMEAIWAGVFPELPALQDGLLWRAESKLELTRQVVARARALGIQLMYVLTYGQFPAAVRAHLTELEWQGNYLCAHQPALQELTERGWRRLLEELGTDHWYALRHRGEEGQSYSDPCRSVSKAEGLTQGYQILKKLDPSAEVTVWTWGEDVPGLFSQLPPEIVAVHIRHGMGNVFNALPRRREQGDGAPEGLGQRRFIQGHFTVFGGNEAQLQTAWSDPAALHRDTFACAGDPRCLGLFQWPEWACTSPWLSEVLVKLGRSPESPPLEQLKQHPGSVPYSGELHRYLDRRYGGRSSSLHQGFIAVMAAGNAPMMSTPRRRRISLWSLTQEALLPLTAVRSDLRFTQSISDGRQRSLVHRDALDLLLWAGWRQAHVFEAAAWYDHLQGDVEGSARHIQSALTTWAAVAQALKLSPDLSLVATASEVARRGDVSPTAAQHFWKMGTEFYGGYPLVPSPEAVELIHMTQTRALGEALTQAHARGERAGLDDPGWFWRDLPGPEWEAATRMLPQDGVDAWREQLRVMIEAAFYNSGLSARTTAPWRGLAEGRVRPWSPPALDPEALANSIHQVVELKLPAAIPSPPQDLPPARPAPK